MEAGLPSRTINPVQLEVQATKVPSATAEDVDRAFEYGRERRSGTTWTLCYKNSLEPMNQAVNVILAHLEQILATSGGRVGGYTFKSTC